MAILDDYNPRDTSKGFVWLKFRTDLVDEPAFMQLTDQSKAVYFEVYFLAGKSDAGGLILSGDKPASIGNLAWLMRRQESDVQNALDELARAGLVDLDNYQVTVCRFANEQGPSMTDQRVQWATRQAKRRARARGEVWPEPDANAEPEPDKNQNREGSKDLKEPEPEQTKDLKPQQIKTKRVTSQSRESHAGVTRDSGGGGDFVSFGRAILQSWQEITGNIYEPNKVFDELVQEWLDEGVTLEDVRQAFLQTKHSARTPIYARLLAINIKNARPEVQAGKELDAWRALYNQNKQAEGRDE